MPEGPEVKRCSEVVRDFMDQKDLHSVQLVSGKLQRQGVKDIENLQLPTKIVRVSSRGKMIFIELKGEYSLVSTLGMSGWWYPPPDSIDPQHLEKAYYKKVIKTIEDASKYIRLKLVATDGSEVWYVDPRNFGNFYALKQTELESRRRSLGIDFLTEDCPEDKATAVVHTKLSKIKKPLGEVLLNQTILAGLGNIYRAETMYLAGLSPHTPANSLGVEEVEKVVKAAKVVLKTAYEGRGSMMYQIDMVATFLGEKGDRLLEMREAAQKRSGTPLNYIGRHLVYGCRDDVMGNMVKSETIGGRTCWWVPEIQA